MFPVGLPGPHVKEEKAETMQGVNPDLVLTLGKPLDRPQLVGGIACRGEAERLKAPKLLP